MKKYLLLSIATVFFIIFIFNIKSYTNTEINTVDDINNISFKGKVSVISNNRGLKIKMDNDEKIYDLTGACNDTACLSYNISWGDTIFKCKNSSVIFLKSTHSNKTSEWFMPNN
ncbi:hypothetical protein KLP40_12725 [Hymenobacter sp. NST-14]|uniref:hypothetical protein n=1 Tax=Hymenobacter piscis TaxID=2839984 RepID=UPI001C036F1B|nr:hypothetical protein [Hymenobacter piscis]MBT9394029.1 hypothetical protein [Hymenobacter piscis]